MERIAKKFLSIALLLTAFIAQADNKGVTPTLVLRSQGFHGDRQKWVGEVGHTNLYEMDSWYGTLDMAVGYMRSFRDDRLANCLFGEDLDCTGCPTIKVQGSGVSDRNAKSWLADYFYLPCNFDGSFTIDPRIQNVVIDLDFYLGLDEWVNGMFFRAYGPITWTKWETGFCPATTTVSTSTCEAGKFTPSGAMTFLAGLDNYFKGDAPATSEGVTFNGLRYAKMPHCDNSRWGFADLRFLLGWNFLQDEDYNLGLYIQAAAPTGTKRRATFVMDPTVGNGNHWELGGGLHGNYVFWRSDDEEKHFGFYFDVSLSHLFDAKEQRTFDLKNKPNSRYMLASKMKNFSSTDLPYLSVATSASATAGGAAGTVVVPNRVFDKQFTPVANLTTMEVDVSIGVQADIVAMFNFTSRGFSWDLGYNFWGRSCESIDCDTSCDDCNTTNICANQTKENQWALKGDSRVFGYDLISPTTNGTPQEQAVPLSSTQSGATIHKGTNADESSTADIARNFGVDTPRFAFGDTDGTNNNILSNLPSSQGGVNGAASTHIKSTKDPSLTLIKCTDVDRKETRGISHKIFTHFSYTWDRDSWVPYLGVGGSAEFGKADSCGDCDDSCSTDCDSCVDCAISQWSVWVKGGLSFN